MPKGVCTDLGFWMHALEILNHHSQAVKNTKCEFSHASFFLHLCPRHNKKNVAVINKFGELENRSNFICDGSNIDGAHKKLKFSIIFMHVFEIQNFKTKFTKSTVGVSPE
ncbi:hypothetical protein ACJX0J_035479 [Zea mays]